MNLYIKQKVFSWGDKFSVYDADGGTRYFVKGEVLSFGKKLHVYDTNGNEIAFIRQKLITFLPKYSIERDGAEIARVVHLPVLFKPKYSVEGLGYTVRGDFFSHEYAVEDAAGREVAGVSKQWFSWGDTYAIRILPSEDEVNLLCVVLVIDACLAQKSRN